MTSPRERVPEGLPNSEPENELHDASISRVSSTLNAVMQGTRLPTQEMLGFESTVGMYGAFLRKDEHGRLVWDARVLPTEGSALNPRHWRFLTGLRAAIDRTGDRKVRAGDDNTLKNFEGLRQRYGLSRKLRSHVIPWSESKRHRGSNAEILDHISELGLQNVYGSHPWGIEIKDKEVFTKGLALLDIFRSDQLGNPAALDGIDRFDALGQASEHLHRYHAAGKATGEANVYRFIFCGADAAEGGGRRVRDPVLNLPDIVWNKKQNAKGENVVTDKEKFTLELLDLLVSAAMEELRRSTGNPESMRHALDTVLDHYGDDDVIRLAASYLRRGRVTMPGSPEGITARISSGKTTQTLRSAAALHNQARLGVTADTAGMLRVSIEEACDAWLHAHAEKE
jgi:hypothetical protein